MKMKTVCTIGVVLVVAVNCLVGCKTTPVTSLRSDAEHYEYVAQILAMPSRSATVVAIAPCNAEFRSEDGRTFYIGSPAAPSEVVRFLPTLEKGKTYRLPEAVMEYQKKQ
jgi:hypothetical protein